MSPQPKVSVIVPVFKVEAYLSKCVESLIGQVYSNLEIILVDDGSPDACPGICDDYAKRDSRIKVIHQKNGGLSDARNTGIRAAKGEYVSFVDSDDWVDPDYIDSLIKTSLDTSADIVECNHIKYYKTDDFFDYSPKIERGEIVVKDGSEAMVDVILDKGTYTVSSWGKIYKMDIFKQNNIWFSVGKIHEDRFVTYKPFFFSRRVAYLESPLYFYTKRKDSITGGGFDEHRLVILRDLPADMREFADQQKINLSREIDGHDADQSIRLFNMMIDDGFDDEQTYSYIKDKIIENYHNIKNNQLIPARRRLVALLIIKLPLYDHIRRTSTSLRRRADYLFIKNIKGRL